MSAKLLARLQWMDDEASVAQRNEYLALGEDEVRTKLRALVRSNGMTVSLRRAEVDKLDDDAIVKLAEQISKKYVHYLDAMESKHGSVCESSHPTRNDPVSTDHFE